MDFENIVIKGSGISETLGSIYENELDISCSDMDLLNQKYFLQIYKSDEELNETGKIGEIEMTYMDVSMADEMGYSVYDLFDMIDSEKQGVCHYLFDGDEPNENYVGIDEDVIYINKIFIDKDFRNLGIGSIIVKELPKLVRNILKLKPGCFVLLANPFEIKEGKFTPTRNKSKIEKLVRFYEKSGFERIEDTQYLVKNMDFR